jgi:hypothetical protein
VKYYFVFKGIRYIINNVLYNKKQILKIFPRYFLLSIIFYHFNLIFFNYFKVLILFLFLFFILHHMTRPVSILEGFRYTYQSSVRIWVISIVIAPNIHISCKSCSSRTKPSVTATMIYMCIYYIIIIIKTYN